MDDQNLNESQPSQPPVIEGEEVKEEEKRVKPYTYDWPALKLEFLEGPWKTVAEFRRAKNLPDETESAYISQKMKGWTNEKKILLKEATEQATTRLIRDRSDDLIKVRERQARLARWLQLKGAEALKTMEPADADEARKLIISGMQEERNALGIGAVKGGGATTLTQVNVNLPKTKFDEALDGADYAELIRLVAEIRRERARRLGADAGSQSQTKAQ